MPFILVMFVTPFVHIIPYHLSAQVSSVNHQSRNELALSASISRKLTYHEGIGAGAAKVSGDVSPVMFTLLYFDTGVELASKQDILAVSSFTPSVIT